jgi:hypothetical protein
MDRLLIDAIVRDPQLRTSETWQAAVLATLSDDLRALMIQWAGLQCTDVRHLHPGILTGALIDFLLIASAISDNAHVRNYGDITVVIVDIDA